MAALLCVRVQLLVSHFVFVLTAPGGLSHNISACRFFSGSASSGSLTYKTHKEYQQQLKAQYNSVEDGQIQLGYFKVTTKRWVFGLLSGLPRILIRVNELMSCLQLPAIVRWETAGNGSND